MSKKVNFDAFNTTDELERWLRFTKHYDKKNVDYDKIANDYVNPIEHRDEILEALTLIHEYGFSLFKIKNLARISCPNNQRSFSARMRYAIRYLNNVGIVEVHRHKKTGRRQSTYKRAVDMDTLKDIIDVIENYNMV